MDSNRPLRRGSNDISAMSQIIREGWIYLEIGSDPWMPSGKTIPRARFDRLLAMGLIEPQGDAMFGTPSQTYRPTKKREISHA